MTQTSGTADSMAIRSNSAEIVTVVESDDSRRFAGEIKTLEEVVKLIVSDF